MANPPYEITVVSHTHWDREWYRTFQQFRVQLIKTIDQLIEILTNNPGYRTFLLDGQTIVLEDYLEIRPEREPELHQLIQEGRLVIGPWHILPDEFLVGAESTVRNLILGEQVSQRFGSRMLVGYTPDPFGHISQLPQILAGVGINSAAFQRGLSDEPTELWWEAPDGTRVLTIFLRTGYGNLSWVPPSLNAFERTIEIQIERLAPYTHTSELLLLNGTDHMLPQSELPQLMDAANEKMAGRAHLQHRSLQDYIERVRTALGNTELPVVRGELRSSKRFHLLPGVFSARMWIKQRNQACETALERYAEPLNAFQSVLGGTNQQAIVWRSWRYLIENHPHDSICGCSIDQVHDEMDTRFDWSEQIAEEVTQNALNYLVAQINPKSLPAPDYTPLTRMPALYTGPGDRDAILMVYNPASGLHTGRVEVNVPWPGIGRQYELLDETWATIPSRWLEVNEEISEQRTLSKDDVNVLLDQIAMGMYGWFLIREIRVFTEQNRARIEMVIPRYHTGEISNFGTLVTQLREQLTTIEHVELKVYIAEPNRLAFVARDVPGVGYRAYRLHNIAGRAAVKMPAIMQETFIENERFHVSANSTDGTLTVTDKLTNKSYSGLNRFVDGGDRGDEYNFCPPENDALVNAPQRVTSIERFDEGALGQTLKISMDYALPTSLTESRDSRTNHTVTVPIVSEICLVPGVPRVDVQITVENLAKDHRLRVHFPTSIQTDTVMVDGHFDRLERSLHLPTDTVGWAEQPQPTSAQRGFVAVKHENQGFMVAVNGLPEYEVSPDASGATIAITLLRCVGWLSRDDFKCRPGHAGPELETPGAQCLGKHTFAYSLMTFSDDMDAAARQAYGFIAPLRAVAAHPQHGHLPSRQAFVKIEPASLVLTAIKSSENHEGVIVRFYNSSTKQVDGRISLALGGKRVTPVNLLEEVIGDALTPDANGNYVLQVPPKRIITLRCD